MGESHYKHAPTPTTIAEPASILCERYIPKVYKPDTTPPVRIDSDAIDRKELFVKDIGKATPV